MTETTTDTRVAIIEAALRCFRTQGLRKTTIVDITRAAAVSRSTVYEYFADKPAIVEATADYASQRFYRELARGHGAFFFASARARSSRVASEASSCAASASSGVVSGTPL